MKKTEKAAFIMRELNRMYPEADCELQFSSLLDLVVAVILSAQTTDKQVNIVTAKLFQKYRSLEDYARADTTKLAQDIRQIGLYRMKAKHIQAMALAVLEKYGGSFPTTIEELITLPGVGRKTANVILSVGFKLPGFAVDTHVARVSKRLGLVREDDDMLAIEHKLKKMFPQDNWRQLHHQFIFFGRYKCKARNPVCEACPFLTICRYYKKNVQKP